LNAASDRFLDLISRMKRDIPRHCCLCPAFCAPCDPLQRSPGSPCHPFGFPFSSFRSHPSSLT
jgi:hypothetical protein